MIFSEDDRATAENIGGDKILFSDKSAEVIWDWDLTTDVVERSPQVAKFGFEDWASVPSIQWWERHIHPDDRAATLSIFRQAKKGQIKYISAEYRFCKANGDVAYIYDRGLVIFDKKGNAIRVAGVMIDVTELRLVKKLVRKADDRLASIASYSAMGAMGSMIAHELQQPLTAVANYIRASRRISASEKTTNFTQLHEALEAAEESALRAGAIIKRLRKLVAGKGLDESDYLLQQIIEDAVLIALSDAQKALIRRTLSVEPIDLTVRVNNVQVQQVLTNLIRNSVEALGSQHNPEITIRAVKSGNFAEISVQDNGVGLTDEMRERIFSEIFTTKDGGMGVGLLISRAIVEAQGGRLWLAPSTEGGADFRFTVPLCSLRKH